MRCLRTFLLGTFAFTVTTFLGGCGANPIPINNSSQNGTGPAPTVTAVAEQVNGVAPNRKQEVQFSEAMNPATIDGSTFVVTDAGGDPMAGAVTYDPTFHLGIFQPDPPLETDKKYTATVTTGVQSAGGVSLASAYTYSFTTRASTDTSPIGILNTDPANGATCVSQTANIVITFTEEPDASTITPQSVTLTGPSGSVAVTMKMDVANTQLVLTPSASLEQNSTYTGTITTEVADLADVHLAAPVTFSFTTGPCSSGGGSNSGTYLYVGQTTPTLALRGYQVDVSAASLTEVPGSPFDETGGLEPGALLVNRNFVYSTSTNETTDADGAQFPSGTSTIWVYRADPASGTLTQIQSLTVSTIQAGLLLDPTGHDIYVLDSNGVLDTDTINSDGTLTSTGAQLRFSGDPVGSIALSPDGITGYATVVTGTVDCGFPPCPTNDATWEINRDPSSGDLTANHQVGTNQHLGNLEFDASGHHLLSQNNQGTAPNQISVDSVNSSTGALTPAPGSPFTTPRSLTESDDDIRAFGLDPSGGFVYALSFGGANFTREYVTVFSLSPTTGVLTPVQTFNMSAGDPTSLVVDRSLVYVVNWYINDQPSGPFTPSTIYAFRRDQATGMLSTGGNPVVMQNQEGLQGAAVMHVQ
jgi:hypothetical protein